MRYGAALLEQRRDLPLAAIGPATARALNQAGYRVAVQSLEGASTRKACCAIRSSTPSRASACCSSRDDRVASCWNKSSRAAAPLLTVAEVYRRECPRPSAAELSALEARFAAHEIHVITATSVEIAANLLALATPRLRRAFDAVHWVVPSARVARLPARARRKGHLAARSLGRGSGPGSAPSSTGARASRARNRRSRRKSRTQPTPRATNSRRTASIIRGGPLA